MRLQSRWQLWLQSLEAWLGLEDLISWLASWCWLLADVVHCHMDFPRGLPVSWQDGGWFPQRAWFKKEPDGSHNVLFSPSLRSQHHQFRTILLIAQANSIQCGRGPHRTFTTRRQEWLGAFLKSCYPNNPDKYQPLNISKSTLIEFPCPSQYNWKSAQNPSHIWCRA